MVRDSQCTHGRQMDGTAGRGRQCHPSRATLPLPIPPASYQSSYVIGQVKGPGAGDAREEPASQAVHQVKVHMWVRYLAKDGLVQVAEWYCVGT